MAPPELARSGRWSCARRRAKLRFRALGNGFVFCGDGGDEFGLHLPQMRDGFRRGLPIALFNDCEHPIHDGFVGSQILGGFEFLADVRARDGPARRFHTSPATLRHPRRRAR